jgi:hypothetical protein
MQINISSLFPHRLCEQIAVFEEELKKYAALTEEDLKDHFSRLDMIAQSLKEFVNLYPLSQKHVSEHLERVISLYGRVTTLYQEGAVQKINIQAKCVEDQINIGKATKTLAKEVDALRVTIAHFWHHHRPLKEGRQIVAKATQSMQRADALLKKKAWQSPLPSSSFATFFEPCEREELAETLFEIGYLFWKNKSELAHKHYDTLPQPIKHHCHRLLSGHSHPPFDSFSWQQCLIKTAYDLTCWEIEPPLPSKLEVEHFFQERATLEPKGKR